MRYPNLAIVIQAALLLRHFVAPSEAKSLRHQSIMDPVDEAINAAVTTTLLPVNDDIGTDPGSNHSYILDANNDTDVSKLLAKYTQKLDLSNGAGTTWKVELTASQAKALAAQSAKVNASLTPDLIFAEVPNAIVQQAMDEPVLVTYSNGTRLLVANSQTPWLQELGIESTTATGAGVTIHLLGLGINAAAERLVAGCTAFNLDYPCVYPDASQPIGTNQVRLITTLAPKSTILYSSVGSTSEWQLSYMLAAAKKALATGKAGDIFIMPSVGGLYEAYKASYAPLAKVFDDLAKAKIVLVAPTGNLAGVGHTATDEFPAAMLTDKKYKHVKMNLLTTGGLDSIVTKDPMSENPARIYAPMSLTLPDGTALQSSTATAAVIAGAIAALQMQENPQMAKNAFASVLANSIKLIDSSDGSSMFMPVAPGTTGVAGKSQVATKPKKGHKKAHHRGLADFDWQDFVNHTVVAVVEDDSSKIASLKNQILLTYALLIAGICLLVTTGVIQRATGFEVVGLSKDAVKKEIQSLATKALLAWEKVQAEHPNTDFKTWLQQYIIKAHVIVEDPELARAARADSDLSSRRPTSR